MKWGTARGNEGCGKLRLWWAFSVAAVVYGIVSALPEGVVSVALCRVPLEGAAAWFGVAPDRAAMTYALGGETFAMTRACAAEGFLAMAVGVMAVRCPRWCWVAYPLTLALNTLRAVAATTAVLALPGFRFERALHLALGTMLFAGVLCGIWLLTEKEGQT